eukprot:CAMPEP_0113705124 /NCGR_PEP_ID=MMETSP0038_2-20120614/26946_1 /TAXON_ID=2898 /ORGANISM="Cryptomonas paramecium" /LENGTH=516 /DNA_ID=CAMNT_0000630073 /DNA_START=232 /DNA_END=1779 /DNA_ORIENTATION=- /assembly_acc=CAM_ASM_000170
MSDGHHLLNVIKPFEYANAIRCQHPNFYNDEGCNIRRPVKPASSKRQQLISKEAVEIYLQRPQKGSRRGGKAHCKVLAPRYGVTPKTIRDIWRGRTWVHATQHLWTEEERTQRLASGATDPSHDGDDSDHEGGADNADGESDSSSTAQPRQSNRTADDASSTCSSSSQQRDAVSKVRTCKASKPNKDGVDSCDDQTNEISTNVEKSDRCDGNSEKSKGKSQCSASSGCQTGSTHRQSEGDGQASRASHCQHPDSADKKRSRENSVDDMPAQSVRKNYRSESSGMDKKAWSDRVHGHANPDPHVRDHLVPAQQPQHPEGLQQYYQLLLQQQQHAAMLRQAEYQKGLQRLFDAQIVQPMGMPWSADCQPRRPYAPFEPSDASKLNQLFQFLQPQQQSPHPSTVPCVPGSNPQLYPEYAELAQSGLQLFPGQLEQLLPRVPGRSALPPAASMAEYLGLLSGMREQTYNPAAAAASVAGFPAPDARSLLPPPSSDPWGLPDHQQLAAAAAWAGQALRASA